MMRLVERAQEAGDTLGGAVTVIAHGVPAGLGSHTHWDEKLDGRLAQAAMSVPAVKAVEIGAALAASRGFGSAAHDPILPAAAGTEAGAGAAPAGAQAGGRRFARAGNRAGGLEGGITNGEDVVVTAYMKPIATLRQGLPSVDLDTLAAHASQYERSDVTALPAAGVIAEAMVALVLADALLEKVGGDSMAELRAHFAATIALQQAWPGGEAPPAG
jgi:chorismate synthase